MENSINITVPITILNATPVTISELVKLEADGHVLLGYKNGNSSKLFACDNEGEKYYIECTNDEIYFVVSEVSQGEYVANIGENSYLDASEVSENPYEEESLTISCNVTGTDPGTGQLITNISLVSASGIGNFMARLVQVMEDTQSVVEVTEFEAI